MRSLRFILPLAAAMLMNSRAAAQSLLKLTLKEARALAVQRHPGLRADTFTARATDQEPDQLAAARYPNVDVAVTGAGARDGTILGAGALSNSTVLSRTATGFTINQLLYDFGRVGSLVESSRLRAKASHQEATATRAQVILNVDRAYFTVLGAQAVLKVSEETVAARRLVVEQTEVFQQSGIRSGLDVSIARYDLAESELLLLKAGNDLRAAFAELTAAIGSGDDQTFELADEPVPSAPLPDQIDAVNAGLRDRPELQALRFKHAAAVENVEAEKLLFRPKVTAIWSAGVIPVLDVVGDVRRHDYNAAAVQVSIPVFEGRFFRARAVEAEYRAKASDEELKDEMNRISRDVRVARLNAETAYRRINLAAELLKNAREALDLAQGRYRLGLSSIVELNQTLLNVTVAEVENARAKFEFLIQRSVFDYHRGQLR